jgi:hypothetical protein
MRRAPRSRSAASVGVIESLQRLAYQILADRGHGLLVLFGGSVSAGSFSMLTVNVSFHWKPVRPRRHWHKFGET